MTFTGRWAQALALVLCLCSYSKAQVITHPISDDGYSNVPLQFGFPYYGQTFNNSWMYDNGVVSFIDPAQPGALSQWAWNATPLSQAPGNYFIAPLWADLAPVAGTTTYTTEGTTQFQRYNWNNLAEYYSIGAGTGLRLNTFSLEIRPSGEIITTYSAVNLQTSTVSVGTVGNVAAGEYNQIYYAQNGTNVSTGTIPNWSMPSTGAVDPCVSSPLSSPSCPGYEAAMLEQMCPGNQLYSPQCPGYAAAYVQQQNKNQTTTVAIVDTSTNVTTTPIDTTRTDETISSAGGVDITTSGQLITPGGLPDVVRNAAADNGIKPKSSVLQIVKNLEKNKLAVALITENYMAGVLNEGQESAGQGLSVTKITVMEMDDLTAPKTKPTTAEKNIAKTTSNIETKEDKAATGPSVKNGGVVEGMEGGPSITAMAVTPMNFNVYLNTQIKDSQFYQQREIYRGQQNVDNRNALRLLNGASDSLHQKMVDQQYGR